MKNKIYRFIFGRILGKIDNLENRIFEKEKESDWWPHSLISSLWGDYQPDTLEKKIEVLQERLGAVEKYLKIETYLKEEQKDWEVRKAKKKK